MWGLFLVAATGASGDMFSPKTDDKGLRKRQRRVEEELRRVVTPPQAIPREVEVTRGGSVEIVLEGGGREGEPLQFKIRSGPAHGRLAPFEGSGVGSVRVVYEHDGGDAGEDQFAYAVQGVGTGVSASATVKIRVVEPESRLVVPTKLDFGSVVVGAAADVDLLLENAGGGRVEGELVVSAPWKIVGVRTFGVGAGQSGVVRVRFEPLEMRAYDGQIFYRGCGETRTSLAGRGVLPFTVEPSMLELAAGGDRSRAGTLRVSNWLGESQEIEVVGGDAFGLPGRVTVGPRGVAEILARVGPERPGKVEGELLFRRGDRVIETVVRGAALPALVTVKPEGPIDLGRVEEGEDLAVDFVLENRGGDAGEIRVQPGAGMSVQASEMRFVLGAGQRRELRVAVGTRDPGTRDSFVAFVTGAGSERREIRTEVVPRARPAAVPAPLAAMVAGATGSVAGETPAGGSGDRLGGPEGKGGESWIGLGEFGRMMARARREGNIAPWALIPEVSDARPTAVRLGWGRPRYDVADYHLEIRRTVPIREGNSLRVGIEWKRWENLSWRQEGDRVVARCWGLTPGGRYLMRVRSLDAGGNLSAPSFPIEAITPQSRGIAPWIAWGVGLTLAAAAGAIVLVRRRRRRRVGRIRRV